MIPDGAHIALGGFTCQRHPMAFVYEMIRQGKRDLHLYGHSPGGDWDILIGAGCVKRIELAYEADEAFGTIGPRMRKAIEGNEIEWEDYSNFAMVTRFAAGAMGLPFLPTKTQFGSALLNYEGFNKKVRQDDLKVAPKKLEVITCPFTGEPVILLPAINVDFTIIHVQQVTTRGTVRMYGQSYGDIQQALCARKLIVTCEEIVEPDVLRAEPEQNQIPFYRVDYIVHVPYGAHPYSCYKYYDYDPEQLAIYQNNARSEGGFREYLNEFIYGLNGHQEYLDRIGSERLSKIAVDPGLGYNPTLKRRL